MPHPDFADTNRKDREDFIPVLPYHRERRLNQSRQTLEILASNNISSPSFLQLCNECRMNSNEVNDGPRSGTPSSTQLNSGPPGPPKTPIQKRPIIQESLPQKYANSSSKGS